MSSNLATRTMPTEHLFIDWYCSVTDMSIKNHKGQASRNQTRARKAIAKAKKKRKFEIRAKAEKNSTASRFARIQY